MAESNRGARLVLGSATLFGLVVLGYYALERPGAVGLNYRVYHAAAEAVLAGEEFYAATPPDTEFRYLYPPVTVLVFVPSALADGWVPGYVVLTGLSVGATAAGTRLLVAYVERLGHSVTRGEQALVFGFLLASPGAAPSLAYGQVNHLLVASLVAGVVWLGRDEQVRAGVALALPAFVKVFPAAVGAWLVRRRARRAVWAAVGAAVALAVAGVAVFGPGATRTYLFEALLPRRETTAFAGGLDPGASYVTLRRPLSVAFPTVDPVWYAVGAAAVLGPVLAVLYWRPTTATDRHVAVHGTLVSMFLFFPSYEVYYPYVAPSLLILLYDLPAGRARRLFVGGALLANLSVSYDDVLEGLRAVPLDPATSAAVRGVLRPVLGVATPVLVGCLVMLAACLVYRVDSRGLDGPFPAPGWE